MDFMFTDLRDLWYKVPKSGKHNDECEWVPSAFKQYLTTYSSNDGYDRVGLLGPDGIPVTPPDYVHIEALGPTLFRCYYTLFMNDEGLSVLINDKGEVIFH